MLSQKVSFDVEKQVKWHLLGQHQENKYGKKNQNMDLFLKLLIRVLKEREKY